MDNNTGRASLQEGYIEDYINCKKDTLATLRQLSQELSEISPPLVIWQNIISEIRSIGSQSATHKYSRIEGPPGPYNKIREEIAGLLNDIESAQKICIQVSENATTALVKLHHRVSDTKDLVNRNFCKGETPPQKLKSIQDDLSQAFKKIEMEYRDLLEEFAVEFKVAHIKFVTSAEAEQSASQKPARAGQGNTVKNLAEKTGQTPAGNIIARPAETEKKTEYVFHKPGDSWEITYKGNTKTIADCGGMGYLKVLLREQGKSFTTQEFLSVYGNGSVRLDSGDVQLDDEAKNNYKKRLAEIDGDIQKAEQENNTVYLQELTKEKQQLIEELKKGTGFGGRKQKLGNQHSQERIGIGKAIKEAIGTIENQLPEMAVHLRESIKPFSGIALSYSPKQPIEWSF